MGTLGTWWLWEGENVVGFFFYSKEKWDMLAEGLISFVQCTRVAKEIKCQPICFLKSVILLTSSSKMALLCKWPDINYSPYLFYLQGGTATGTCGTVSWQIEHLDTRLIVMWSVPFNYNIHDSYFAVGMIFNRGRFTSSSYWFNQMYYSEKGPYKRGHGGQNITFENSAIVVHATMEPTTYHPTLNISVLPQVSLLSYQLHFCTLSTFPLTTKDKRGHLWLFLFFGL